MSTISGPAYRIVAPRLVVRCWNPADAALFKKAVDESKEHLLPWLPWAAGEPTDLQSKIDTLRYFRGKFDLNQDYYYGIFNSDETQVVGGAGLHTRLGPNAREIGYWIHAQAINQGFATEVSAALTRVAFEIDQVDRVEIHCDPANLRSAAVPRKLGFTHEATLRRRVLLQDGKARDAMIWCMLSEEYPGSTAAQIQIEAYDAAGRKIGI